MSKSRKTVWRLTQKGSWLLRTAVSSPWFLDRTQLARGPICSQPVRSRSMAIEIPFRAPTQQVRQGRPWKASRGVNPSGARRAYCAVPCYLIMQIVCRLMKCHLTPLCVMLRCAAKCFWRGMRFTSVRRRVQTGTRAPVDGGTAAGRSRQRLLRAPRTSPPRATGRPLRPRRGTPLAALGNVSGATSETLPTPCTVGFNLLASAPTLPWNHMFYYL